jgi:hypothetical protein
MVPPSIVAFDNLVSNDELNSEDVKYWFDEPSAKLSVVNKDIAVAANLPADEMTSVEPTVKPYSITNVFCVAIAVSYV